MPEQLVECVPNISEGRDAAVYEAVAAAAASVEGVSLLDVDPGAETNRTVITFVASPEAAIEGAFRLVAKAAELIDMAKHVGAHARIGATDVCPFVPVSGISMEECAKLAHRLGRRVGEELSIPVYFYEEAAKTPERRNLAEVRKGQYEGLSDKLADASGKPDEGPVDFNERTRRTGATIIGARPFLIAYNVNLNCRHKKAASYIALRIRERGRVKRDASGTILRDEKGVALRQPGLFKCVKAVGWVIPEYGRAQVSINLTDYRVAPPHEVFDACRRLAAEVGVRVTGSELVGLIPKEAILMAGRHYLRIQKRSEGIPERQIVETAIQSLGLADISPFSPQEKIIEYRVKPGDGPLVRQTIRDFTDELSTESPAPGGGSVAALLGAQSAALSAMVANLTAGRKGYEKVFDEMNRISREAQECKDRFLSAIDRDTDAFNAVLAARRLPKKSDEEKARREEAIEAACVEATSVPLAVLRDALEALRLAAAVAGKGLQASASDAGVAAAAARSAAEGAHLNVLINLPSIGNETLREKMRQEALACRQEVDEIADTVRSLVEESIASG